MIILFLMGWSYRAKINFSLSDPCGRVPARVYLFDVRGRVPRDDGGEAVRVALQDVPLGQEDEGRLRRAGLQALWPRRVRVGQGSGKKGALG